MKVVSWCLFALLNEAGILPLKKFLSSETCHVHTGPPPGAPHLRYSTVISKAVTHGIGVHHEGGLNALSMVVIVEEGPQGMHSHII